LVIKKISSTFPWNFSGAFSPKRLKEGEIMNKCLFKGLIAATLILGTAVLISAQTPVQKHGELSTSGGYLLNKKGISFSSEE
jgi:hypothetical protein